MDEFIVEQRGKQMTERAAVRAKEGIRSRPAAHLGFREARASSHHSGVVGKRERVGGGGDGVGSEAGDGGEVEELAEAKWVLRVSELKEDQLPEEDEVGEVVGLSVFQITERCEFLLISRLKYSFLVLCCNQTTRFRWALYMSLEAAERLRR